MKSCIFVNKDTPKFKGAREELHVINCSPPGFSSREALAQETVQFKMSQWRMVPAVAQKQAKTFCLLWKQMVLTKQQDHKLKKVSQKESTVGVEFEL